MLYALGRSGVISGRGGPPECAICRPRFYCRVTVEAGIEAIDRIALGDGLWREWRRWRIRRR